MLDVVTSRCDIYRILIIVQSDQKYISP